MPTSAPVQNVLEEATAEKTLQGGQGCKELVGYQPPPSSGICQGDHQGSCEHENIEIVQDQGTPVQPSAHVATNVPSALEDEILQQNVMMQESKKEAASEPNA